MCTYITQGLNPSCTHVNRTTTWRIWLIRTIIFFFLKHIFSMSGIMFDQRNIHCYTVLHIICEKICAEKTHHSLGGAVVAGADAVVMHLGLEITQGHGVQLAQVVGQLGEELSSLGTDVGVLTDLTEGVHSG